MPALLVNTHPGAVGDVLTDESPRSIAFVRAKDDIWNLMRVQVTADELFELFERHGHPVGTKDNGAAPVPLPGTSFPFCGWVPAMIRGGGARVDADVLFHDFLVLDFDNKDPKTKKPVPAEQRVSIDDVVALLPYWGFVHTSHSHTADVPAFRVIFPLAERVASADHLRLWSWVMDLTGRTGDEKCKNASRFYYAPRCTSEAKAAGLPEMRRIEGRSLSLADVPANYASGAPTQLAQARGTGYLRLVPQQGAHRADPDLRELRAKLDTFRDEPIVSYMLDGGELSRDAWRFIGDAVALIAIDYQEGGVDLGRDFFHEISRPDARPHHGYSPTSCEAQWRDCVRRAWNSLGDDEATRLLCTTYDRFAEHGVDGTICNDGMVVAAAPVAWVTRKFWEAEEGDGVAAGAPGHPAVPVAQSGVTMQAMQTAPMGTGAGATAMPSSAQGTAAHSSATAAHATKGRRASISAAQSRVDILVTTEEHDVTNEAIAALANDPLLFARGPSLCRVIREVQPPKGSVFPPNSLRVSPAPTAHLRDRLTKFARLLRKSGRRVEPVNPPPWLPAAIQARGSWDGIRPLVAVVESPILRPDGTVLDQPGYDDETGLLYMPTATFPIIPASPTFADAQVALDALREVIVDFPFPTEAHRSACLAALITPFARFAFSGCVPLFLFDANARGVGKSLLCEIAGHLAQGHPMAGLPVVEGDDAEMRKQITTVAYAGTRLVVFDNVSAALGSASLDRALTSTRWQDRLLSTNTSVDVPLFIVWYANGNNVALVADTARRVLHVRLETPEEQPETKTGFRHPDLRAWVERERPRLAAAALTVLRAYFVAGRPKAPLPAWGSYEAWSDLIRQGLVWLGLPDPADTRAQLIDDADITANALHELLEGLHEFDTGRGGNGSGGYTAGQILSALEANPTTNERLRSAISELVPTSQGKVSAGRLGKKMFHLRGRVSGGRRLVHKGEKGGSKLWAVETVGAAATGNSASGGTSAATPPTGPESETTPENDNPNLD